MRDKALHPGFAQFVAFAITSLTLLTASVICRSSMHAQGAPVKIDRNLSEYEKAGPFDFRLRLYREQPERVDMMLSELRDFLWKHWKKRQPATVQVTFYSKEGEANVSTIFLEKGPLDSWHVVVETEQELASRIPSDFTKVYRNISSVYQVLERVEPLRMPSDGLMPSNGRFIPVVIDDTEFRAPSAYQIRLRNSVTKREWIF